MSGQTEGEGCLTLTETDRCVPGQYFHNLNEKIGSIKLNTEVFDFVCE